MTTWWFPLERVLALARHASTAASFTTGDGVDEPALILTDEGASRHCPDRAVRSSCTRPTRARPAGGSCALTQPTRTG